MRAVIVNDKRHRGFDARREIVTIEPGAMPITLRAEFRNRTMTERSGRCLFPALSSRA